MVNLIGNIDFFYEADIIIVVSLMLRIQSVQYFAEQWAYYEHLQICFTFEFAYHTDRQTDTTMACTALA